MAQRDWNPNWWSNEDSSAWDRVKDALRRDWEQTKHDFSKSSGAELNQDVDDTIRQAAGKQGIPPGSTPNPPDTSKRTSTAAPSVSRSKTPNIDRSKLRDDDWARSEHAIRYGYGAADHYKGREWDPTLEDDLRKEWSSSGEKSTWDEIKDFVRHGFSRRRDTTTRR